MDNDDLPVGRILTRREALALLGATGAALIVACAPGQTPTVPPTPASATSVGATSAPATSAAAQATATTASASLPACVVRPEVTEGPYYVNEELNRSDVRSDTATGAVSAGAPLALTFNVSQVGSNGCTPLQGAKVEIWHCDAAGSYSDVSDPGFNTRGHNYLRGYQMTDANGQATFNTIYPGWYQGRAVHIHFKVHPDANHVFTSQLFFDDTLSDRVFANPPYASKGTRGVRNNNDGIYKPELLTPTTKTGDAYATTFDIGMQLS